MAGEVNLNPAQRPTIPVDISAQAEKANGADSAKVKEVVGKAMEILAGHNLNVTRADTAGADGAAEKKTAGATNVPALDNPNDVEQLEANLEKLISYLQLDNEERQTAMAKDRIELQKSSLDKEHDGRMKEINESVKKMQDAEKSSKISRIFGWIGAILSVVAAVALTVVSGGTAAAFAIAGAVLAVTSLVMNETGAMDAITEKLAKHLQEKYGWDKNKSQLIASLVINLTIMAGSLACSIGGMVSGISSAAKAVADGANAVHKVSELAKNVQNAITILNTATTAAALAAGGANTYLTYRAESKQADVTELEKFIQQLQQRLDESEEELEQILEQIESNIGAIADLLSSATDTSAQIAQNIGAMA